MKTDFVIEHERHSLQKLCKTATVLKRKECIAEALQLYQKAAQARSQSRPRKTLDSLVRTAENIGSEPIQVFCEVVSICPSQGFSGDLEYLNKPAQLFKAL